MKIVLGCDHGGYLYKEEIKKFLEDQGIKTLDVGCYSTESTSWSEFGLKAATKVSNKEADYGIVICKSGIGVCIAANKVKGVYCGIPYNDEIAIKCKAHDGCNMIAFGSEYFSLEDIKRRITLFLNTEFEGGRHLKRLNNLKKYENNN